MDKQQKMEKVQFNNQKHVEVYAKCRPEYNSEVFDAIINYHREGHGQFRLAVDVGCGNGQSTIALCEYFESVIGIDASQAQIDLFQTKNVSNVSFHVGAAEDMSIIGDSSVDLITCAASLHWFDMEKFYSEVKRTLKPNGSLIVYSYGNMVMNNPDATNLVKNDAQFMKTILKANSSNSAKIVVEKYRNVKLPFPTKRTDELEVHKKMTVDEYMGFTFSLGMYQKFKRENPDEKEFENLKIQLKAIYGDSEFTVTWPIFMLLSRKPT